MLNPEDRRAIEGLFDRLASVEQKNPDRDSEAQELIDREIVRQPGAPYYMAQTILVQAHALEVAERRIAELEREAESRGRGGLFGGLFDDGRGRQNRPDERQSVQEQPVQRRGGPWDRQDDAAVNGQQRGQGGGFLAGAAQTALGVAGGVLLGSAIGSMFGSSGAQASEAPASDQPADAAANQPDPNQDQSQDQGADQGGGDDGGWGNSGGDGGGFDMGGDF